MIRKQLSKCKICMILIRLITLQGLVNNTRVFAKHVKTDENGMADALSRLQFQRFKKLCLEREEKEGLTMNLTADAVPECLLPDHKLWIN